MNESGRNEVTRRDLIKKSAVAGGVIWATPLVVGSIASAGTVQTCPQGSCPTYHRIKLDSGEQPVANADETGVDCNHFIDLAGGGQCALPVPAGATLVATTCAQFNAHALSVEDGVIGFPGNSIKIVLAPGYQFVAGFSKKGSPDEGDQCPGSQGGPAIISNNCTTATFPANSHVEFLYCGPN